MVQAASGTSCQAVVQAVRQWRKLAVAQAGSGADQSDTLCASLVVEKLGLLSIGPVS